MMDWEKFWELFHRGWGQATNSPEYDKNVWSNMQRMLLELEKQGSERRSGGTHITRA